jgi:pilus assembly protein FimV
MLTRNCCRVLLLALLIPGATMALGLGEIHLKSALNAPLDADIDVVGASADELAGLKASLASRDTFTRYRLEYSTYMAGVTLEPRQTQDGRTVLHMHSADAVNEPIATLLVEVNWARGHLVREYTVLLDPPVFSSETPSASGVAAPATGDAARSGSVERRAPAAVASAAPVAAASAASSGGTRSAPAGSTGAASGSGAASGGAAPGGSYTVRRGDTLSSITNEVYGTGDHLAHQRALVGVYRANPAAFDGNMNVLRSGSRLTLPGDAELVAISPGDAAAEVHRQFSTWNETHGAAAGNAAGTGGSGQLRLVPPTETATAPTASAPAAAAAAAAAATPSAGAGPGSAALQQRVSQLESQLAESQRLLALKNAELATLQSKAAAGTPVPAPAAAAAPPAAVAPTPTPAKPAAVSPPAPAPAPPPVAAAPTPPPVAAAPTPPPAAAPAPKAAPAAPAAGGSFMDLLLEYWYLPAGLVAVLIVLLVLRAVRSRQEDAFDRSLGRLSTPAFDSKPVPEPPKVADTMPVRALAPSREEQAYRVEESGAHEQPTASLDTSASGRHVAMDVPTEAPVALDQGDPLAEADFHMAYGLYDQAADLVQIAISREPERRDLRLKLLEVFFVWGNKDRFLATARELAGSRDQALPGEWEKIVIMGRQIAPEDALFSSGGALSGAASGGVDLNLEGGQNRIDFDLMGEPTVSSPGGHAVSNAAVDLDLGAALGDTETTGESRSASESGVDFVFDDAERGNEQTGSTREMPARGGSATTVTVQVTGAPGADADAPTVEQPQLPGGDHPTIRQKIDAAKRGGMVASDQTAELELHDLGLDLGSMEHVADETEIANVGDAPTMLAGLDEETRQMLGRAEADRAKGEAAKPPGNEPTDSGTWLFTDTDFVDVATTPGAGRAPDAPTEVVTQIAQRPEVQPPSDSSATSRLTTLETNGLDLDLSDLNKTSIERAGGNGVDLDVGAPTSGSEGTFVQTQRIMAEDVPLPDLEPATMSEVGTKLDLARAYMDMGDPEGARSILSEVLSEGSVSQKQEARRLIDTLPG